MPVRVCAAGPGVVGGNVGVTVVGALGRNVAVSARHEVSELEVTPTRSRTIFISKSASAIFIQVAESAAYPAQTGVAKIFLTQ